MLVGGAACKRAPSGSEHYAVKVYTEIFTKKGYAMNRIDDIFARARARKDEYEMPYAGALTPREAFEVLEAMPQAKLVDVRSQAELDWVGRPAVPPAQYCHIEWNRYPGSVRNADFLAQLRSQISVAAPTLLLCRSAVRSKAAAILAAQAGVPEIYDILEGFEGDKDATGHRKSVNGWCYQGLPWLGA